MIEGDRVNGWLDLLFQPVASILLSLEVQYITDASLLSIQTPVQELAQDLDPRGQGVWDRSRSSIVQSYEEKYLFYNYFD